MANSSCPLNSTSPNSTMSKIFLSKVLPIITLLGLFFEFDTIQNILQLLLSQNYSIYAVFSKGFNSCFFVYIVDWSFFNICHWLIKSLTSSVLFTPLMNRVCFGPSSNLGSRDSRIFFPLLVLAFLSKVISS